MADGDNAGSNNDGGQAQTFTAEEYQKVVERAQRFEGLLKDTEVKYKEVSKKIEGIDFDDYKAQKAKNEELEKKLAESDPKKLEEYHDKRFQKALNGWNTERDELTKDRDALKAQVKSYAVTDKVMNEIGGLFNDDVRHFIKAEVEKLCDLDDEGQIYVKGEDGKPALKGYRPLTIKDLGEQLVEKYPSMARSTASGGSKGASPGEKTNGRVRGLPQSYAELQSMPNSKEVLAKIQREEPALLEKILNSAPIGSR